MVNLWRWSVTGLSVYIYTHTVCVLYIFSAHSLPLPFMQLVVFVLVMHAISLHDMTKGKNPCMRHVCITYAVCKCVTFRTFNVLNVLAAIQRWMQVNLII